MVGIPKDLRESLLVCYHQHTCSNRGTKAKGCIAIDLGFGEKGSSLTHNVLSLEAFLKASVFSSLRLLLWRYLYTQESTVTT